MAQAKKFPLVGAFYGALFVIGFWLACYLKWMPFGPDEQSALFTGLGFVGLVAAFLHERDQAALGDEAHTELLEAMKLQAKFAQQSSRVMALTTLLTASLDEWDTYHSTSMDTPGAKACNDRIELLRDLVEKATEEKIF